jgi:hypothetical protein
VGAVGGVAAAGGAVTLGKEVDNLIIISEKIIVKPLILTNYLSGDLASKNVVRN